MDPIDLTRHRPRGPRDPLLGFFFLARTVDKLRAELPGGNLGAYLNHDTGFRAYIVRRLGLEMGELRDAVARSADEADLCAWLAGRIDLATAPALNADQVLVRERHPVMAAHPDLDAILDILEADDAALG